MKTKLQPTRRQILQQSAAAGAALALTGCGAALAGAAAPRPGTKIKSRGYAAFDASGTLKPWEFERRPVGDHDILIAGFRDH